MWKKGGHREYRLRPEDRRVLRDEGGLCEDDGAAAAAEETETETSEKSSSLLSPAPPSSAKPSKENFAKPELPHMEHLRRAAEEGDTDAQPSRASHEANSLHVEHTPK